MACLVVLCQLKLLKNTDNVARIKVHYCVYMYDGKLGMHLPENFELTGNIKLFSAWTLWLNLSPGYSCTNEVKETIDIPIRRLLNFTVDSIRNKLWKNFNTVWKTVLMMIYIAPSNDCISGFLRNSWGQITEENIQ